MPYLWILLLLTHYTLKFQELLVLLREIYLKQKLVVCTINSRTVVFRTVGYVPFHSICYNLALLTTCFTHS